MDFIRRGHIDPCAKIEKLSFSNPVDNQGGSK
jgi:hypothetical protein